MPAISSGEKSTGVRDTDVSVMALLPQTSLLFDASRATIVAQACVSGRRTVFSQLPWPCPLIVVYSRAWQPRRMNRMDAFEELGITAVAQVPSPGSTSRTVGEAVTTVVAGTALIACGIVGLVLIAIFALVFSAPTL
jgi:hypothetical protein